MIEYLPQRIFADTEREPFAGPDHPIRKATREVAFGPAGWTPERAAKVAQLFNAMAPEWHTRGTRDRMQPLVDGLERGGVDGECCVELGSGTGFGTELLQGRFRYILAVDLAIEMLRLAPAEWGTRLLADAARLPVRDGVVDALVHVNAFLFPAEAERVIAPGGALVWVSTLGDQTPIYLSAEEVASALPGSWRGVASEAGWGTWCVLRRSAAAG